MEQRNQRSSNSNRKTNYKKLEAICHIDNEAKDIESSLESLVEKIESLQKSEQTDQWITHELGLIKKKVKKLHQFSLNILLKNQAYYKATYERKNKSDQVY